MLRRTKITFVSRPPRLNQLSQELAFKPQSSDNHTNLFSASSITMNNKTLIGIIKSSGTSQATKTPQIQAALGGKISAILIPLPVVAVRRVSIPPRNVIQNPETRHPHVPAEVNATRVSLSQAQCRPSLIIGQA